MNTVSIGYTRNNEPKGKSGSDHYANSIAQKCHEKIGVPYQARTPQELLFALCDSFEGITVVELETGEFLYGFVPYPEFIPSKQMLKAVNNYVGVKNAYFFSKAGA